MNRYAFRIFLLSVVITLALAGIFYLAWLNHDDFENAIVHQARQQLSFIAASEAQSIEGYLNNVQQELVILSEESIVAKSLTEQYNPEIYTFLADSYKDVKLLVDALYLINAEGIVISSSPAREGVLGRDFSGMPDVATALKYRRAFVSGVFKTSPGKLAISVLQPVYKHADFIGLLRAVILVDRIGDLTSHINSGNGGYIFIIDGEGVILNYPERGFIGKNISHVIDARELHPDLGPLMRVIGEMMSGANGTGIIQFLSEGYKPKVATTIIAYAPIRMVNYRLSIAVAMGYGVFSDLIHKNVRDNAFFTGLVLIFFLIFSLVFYRIHREKDKHEISEVALKIINKQLHLEIDEYKTIRKKLHDHHPDKRRAKP